MHTESKPGNAGAPPLEPVEPDYDELPRGEFNPMWDVAIAMGILLAVLAAIVAFS